MLVEATTMDIEESLKTLIIRELALEDVEPRDIDSDEPLFGDGLGLDSIDALEIGIILKTQFGITIESATADVKAHFRSIRTLARFVVAENAKK